MYLFLKDYVSCMVEPQKEKRTKISLNDIKKRHLERLEKYSDTKSSQVSDTFWIFAVRKKGKYPNKSQLKASNERRTEVFENHPKVIESDEEEFIHRGGNYLCDAQGNSIHMDDVEDELSARMPGSGKWLVFVDRTQVDDIWARIKRATEEGKLGAGAKVSTAKTNPNSTDISKNVICVYTYDWTDKEDVMRIREELRQIGITWKIPYKSDLDTIRGKYRVKGDRRISKYFE